MISIVVPFRPTEERMRLWQWCRAHWAAMIPGAEILDADSGHEPFSRSASINLGVANTQGDKIIVADADTVISNVVGLYVALEGPRWLIGYDRKRYFPLSPDETSRLLGRAPGKRLPDPPPGALGITSWSGVLAFRRDQFVGFDERFDDWGWEDRAFVHAMDTLHGPHARVDGYALHLWHPRGADWASPGIKYREALWRRYADADGNLEAMRRILAEPR